MRRLIAIFFLFISFSKTSLAQLDPHFSQYYALPLWLNPALTGYNGSDLKLTVNHRRQWVGIDGALETTAASLQISSTNNLAYGLSFITQDASSGSYHNTTVNFNLSYNAYLSETNILAAGFQIGVLNKWLDQTKFQFGNQYNPFIGYDPSMQSNESFGMSRTLQFDIGAGLMFFSADPDKKFNPFIGVSIFHPNHPTDAFLKGTGSEKMPARFVIHGGGKLLISDNVDLTPHFIAMQQGVSNEISAGVLVNANISDNIGFLSGISYRFGKALIPVVGLQNKEFKVGLSYDIPMSSTKNEFNLRNAYEISVSFDHTKKHRDITLSCPKF